jgi:hypothetical protein
MLAKLLEVKKCPIYEDPPEQSYYLRRGSNTTRKLATDIIDQCRSQIDYGTNYEISL